MRDTIEMAKDIWVGDVQAGKYDNETVELKGWIKRARGFNKIRFVVLRDSTGEIQCKLGKEMLSEMMNLIPSKIQS